MNEQTAEAYQQSMHNYYYNDDTNPEIKTVYSLLFDLQPLIHFTAHILRLIQWKNINYKYSLISLLLWITVRSLQGFILYLIPIILLFVIVILDRVYPSFYQQYYEVEEQRKSLKEDLTEIRSALYFISSIKDLIRKSDTLCNLHHRHFSMATVKQRAIVYFGVACLFIVTYIEWIVLMHQQIINSYASIIWISILMVMCLRSPWMKPMLNAIKRITFPCIYYLIPFYDNNDGISIVTNRNTSLTTTTTFNSDNNVQNQQIENNNHTDTTAKVYCFELYHHQRWWFPFGWSDYLLPQDRPIWSDIYLEPTPSIHNFMLPPTTTTYFVDSNKFHQQKTISWTWVDPCWSKQQNNDGEGEYNKNGWQYGNFKWKSWSFQSSGFSICTRRQKWFRYAQREETLVRLDCNTIEEELEANGSSCCSSFSEGSGTTAPSSISSSLYDWDDITTTDSNVNSSDNSIMSASSKYSKPPILISNIVDRTSSPSTTFDMPILLYNSNTQQPAITHSIEEDDMYKEYWVSPNSNKSKRHINC